MKRKTIVVLLSIVAVLCAGLALGMYGWLPFLAGMAPRLSERSPNGFVYSFLLDIDSEKFEVAYGLLSPSYRRQKDFTSWKIQMKGNVRPVQPWAELLRNVKANPWSLSVKNIDANHWRIRAPKSVADLLSGEVARLDFTVERQPDKSLSIVDDGCLWGGIWTDSSTRLYRLVELDDDTHKLRSLYDAQPGFLLERFNVGGKEYLNK